MIPPSLTTESTAPRPQSESRSEPQPTTSTEQNGFKVQGRIVGGTTAKPRAYPSYVRIDSYDRVHCGGTLVAPDVILTCAHCKTGGMEVSVNGYISNDDFNVDAHPRSIVETLPHPDYVKATFEYDYMLLKIDEPVFGLPFQIFNANESLPIDGDVLTVIGLGALQENGAYPFRMQEATVEPVDLEFCEAAYRTLGLDGINEDVQFCAGFSDGRMDTCQGDSGGPILDMSRGGIQIGVVSFGYGCGRPGFPGVYGRTSSVYDWLWDTICNTTDFPAGLCTDSEYYETSIIPSHSPSQMPSEESAAISPLVPGLELIPATTTTAPGTAFSVSTTPRPSPRTADSSVSGSFTEVLLQSDVLLTASTQPSSIPGASPTATIEPYQFSPVPVAVTNAEMDSNQSVSRPAQMRNDVNGLGVCDDSIVEFRIGSNRAGRDCYWLRRAPQQVQTKFCTVGSRIYHLCEETCGKCNDDCLDRNFVVFPLDGVHPKELPTCEYLKDRPNLIRDNCVNTHPAYFICPETCNACGDETVFLQSNEQDGSPPPVLRSQGRSSAGLFFYDWNGPETCEDSPETTFYLEGENGPPRSCAWLGQTASHDMRENNCVAGSDVYNLCEETCGKCGSHENCADHESIPFPVSAIGNAASTQFVTCEGLQSDPDLTETLCVNNHPAYFICPQTCHSCGIKTIFISEEELDGDEPDPAIANQESGKDEEPDPAITNQESGRDEEDPVVLNQAPMPGTVRGVGATRYRTNRRPDRDDFNERGTGDHDERRNPNRYNGRLERLQAVEAKMARDRSNSDSDGVR